jgi:hypothetical protein
MVRKGSGVLVAVFILLLLIILFSLMGLSWFFGSSTEREANIQTDLYAMANTLEATRFYLEGSMDYSVYQACYDMLKRGGYSELPKWSEDGEVYWYDNGDKKPPTKEKYKSDLETLIKNNFRKYTKDEYSYLMDYMVQLPEYQIYVEEKDESFSVVTNDWDKRLRIEKTNEEENTKIELESSPYVERTYALPCIRMYSYVLDEWDSFKGILPVIVDYEISDWPSQYIDAKRPYTDSSGKISEPTEAEKNQAFYNALLGAKGREELNKMGVTYENALSKAAEAASYDIYSIGSGIRSVVEGINPQFTVAVTNETSVKIKIRATGSSTETIYRFDYEVSADMRVEVASHEKVPVFNGREISYEPVKLVFHIRESRK